MLMSGSIIKNKISVHSFNIRKSGILKSVFATWSNHSGQLWNDLSMSLKWSSDVISLWHQKR